MTKKDVLLDVMFYIVIESRCGLHCDDYCKYRVRCDMSRLAYTMIYEGQY